MGTSLIVTTVTLLSKLRRAKKETFYSFNWKFNIGDFCRLKGTQYGATRDLYSFGFGHLLQQASGCTKWCVPFTLVGLVALFVLGHACTFGPIWVHLTYQ